MLYVASIVTGLAASASSIDSTPGASTVRVCGSPSNPGGASSAEESRSRSEVSAVRA